VQHRRLALQVLRVQLVLAVGEFQLRELLAQ
jgi:hypothetical protein